MKLTNIHNKYQSFRYNNLFLSISIILFMSISCYFYIKMTILNANANEITSANKVEENNIEENKTNSIGTVTGFPIPRFVTLKSKDINVRAGPGHKYPLRLNYKCRGCPVQITAEFENWRLIKDHQGNEGWVHEHLLSSIHNVIVVKNTIENENILQNETLLFRFPNEKSRPIARVEFGAILSLKKCVDSWCNVSLGRSYNGWIPKYSIWGVMQ